MDPKNRSQFLTIPGAIIVAGALIAIAVIWSNKPGGVVSNPAGGPSPASNGEPAAIDLSPVTASDHILGNPNADIKIVEYSDPSCPFCKLFDPTMHQLVGEYGPGGKVAWIYREFPLDQPGTRPDGGVLHPNAGREAEALECAALVGGNTKFWAYEKKWYEDVPEDGASRPAADDEAAIVRIAKDTGLDTAAFSDCLSSGKTKDLVQKDYESGLNAGVSGTPYSIIITPSGSKVPLVGAQPYATVKAAIDALILGN